MAINTSKVITGGVVAGVILTAVDMVSNYMLIGDRMVADANAFKPGLGDSMTQMSGGQMAGWAMMNIVVGMLLIWTYAGFRTRFGPGPRTASYVALTFFTFGLILTSNYMAIGMMSKGLSLTYGVIWLIALLVATMAGAKFYSEDSSTT